MTESAKNPAAYLTAFITIFLILNWIPKTGGYIWQPGIINGISALLIVLLTFLVGRITATTQNFGGIWGTTLFIFLFYPNAQAFFLRDETAIIELTSVCIVPFFISQYNRIQYKDFTYGYFLMLLMGIFCSYTHDGITIPLCMSFLILSYMQRNEFFRRACWPMVIGFATGTALSLLHAKDSSWENYGNLHFLSEQTATALTQLWETKIFILSLSLTLYFFVSRKRRNRLWGIIKRKRLLSLCLFFSLCTVPFAPLGIDNAIQGVCFFCMFWTLFLIHDLITNIRKQQMPDNMKRAITNKTKKNRL